MSNKPVPLTLTIEDCGEAAVVHLTGKLVLGVTELLYKPGIRVIGGRVIGSGNPGWGNPGT